MRRAAASIVLAWSAACSSWDTGTPPADGPEKVCRTTIETFARAFERCGADYQSTYDSFLIHQADGDCKNVRSIRDEAALRATCLPSVMSAPCDDLLNGKTDATCAKQLVRTASVPTSF